MTQLNIKQQEYLHAVSGSEVSVHKFHACEVVHAISDLSGEIQKVSKLEGL